MIGAIICFGLALMDLIISESAKASDRPFIYLMAAFCFIMGLFCLAISRD